MKERAIDTSELAPHVSIECQTDVGHQAISELEQFQRERGGSRGADGALESTTGLDTETGKQSRKAAASSEEKKPTGKLKSKVNSVLKANKTLKQMKDASSRKEKKKKEEEEVLNLKAKIGDKLGANLKDRLKKTIKKEEK